ncbi:hypothetical protein [Leeuwenhoekiella sp.]|uniref:hypothetical protein n=1 Tax=Leeuwenhoekiella sp. TaxID=1977054 RepID=UPI000C47E079|nr:hypothetical protein [Leeuwenhoekiella sp.]MAO42159.1 hypothetical protein [Leeuwenhoekiella sp.]
MKPEEIAKSIFARNPEIKELHITADGQAFRDLHAAESHAQRSKYQKIASIKRDGKAKEQTPDADPDKSFADNAQKVAKAAKVKDTVNPDSAAAAAQKANDTDADADAEGDDTTEDNALEAILDGNVSQTTERLQTLEEVEALEKLSTLEKEGDNRKGVHEAIASRKEAITNPKED